MNVRENNPAGGLVNVTFPSPTPADGVLIFGLETSSKYGVDFITEPAAVSGKGGIASCKRISIGFS
ncbi:MAG: hypothetical protein WDO15_28115 [Bacteroidota bacterium]